MTLREELIGLRNSLIDALGILKTKNLVQTKAKLYTFERKLIDVKNFLIKNSIKETNRLIIAEEVVNMYNREVKYLEDNELFGIINEELKNKITEALTSITQWLEGEMQERIQVEYSPKYIREKQKKVYIDNLILINKTEEKIEQYYLKRGLPGGNNIAKIDPTGKTKFLHAAIPYPLDNHRILYAYDQKQKKILYLDIGTHKELGFGGSGS